MDGLFLGMDGLLQGGDDLLHGADEPLQGVDRPRQGADELLHGAGDSLQGVGESRQGGKEKDHPQMAQITQMGRKDRRVELALPTICPSLHLLHMVLVAAVDAHVAHLALEGQ